MSTAQQTTDYKQVPSSDRQNEQETTGSDAVAAATVESANEAPPPYSGLNILRQVSAAKDLNDPKEQLGFIATILFGSVITTVCLGLYSVVPVIQIIIGVYNRDKCQIEPLIPMWLLVHGAVSLGIFVLKFLSNIIVMIKKRKNADAKEPMFLNCFNCCGSLFLLVWFILGNIWIYSKWNSVQYSSLLDPNTYCDKLTYLFAFWSVTITYIFIGLFCFCFCGLALCVLGGTCCAFAVSSKK